MQTLGTSSALRLQVLVSAIGVGAIAAVYTIPATDFGNVPALGLLAGLAAIAGLATVRLGTLGLRVTATDPFVFCALGLFGALPAVLVSTAAFVGYTLVRPRGQTFTVQAFNFASLTLSTAVAGHAFSVLGGTPGQGLTALLPALVTAMAVYFLTNTALTAMAVATRNASGFFATWSGSSAPTLMPFFTAMMIAAGMLVLFEAVGLRALILGLPPAFTLAASLRLRSRQPGTCATR